MWSLQSISDAKYETQIRSIPPLVTKGMDNQRGRIEKLGGFVARNHQKRKDQTA